MVELLKGDCFDYFKLIKNKSVDMILCDMPYGTTQNKWDTIIPLDKLWKEYNRITKDNAAIVLFSQQPFTSILINSNIKKFRYEWIWEKSQATGFLNSKKMPMKCHENVCVFYNKLPLYEPQFEWGGDIHTKIVMPLAQIMERIIKLPLSQMADDIQKISSSLMVNMAYILHKNLSNY